MHLSVGCKIAATVPVAVPIGGRAARLSEYVAADILDRADRRVGCGESRLNAVQGYRRDLSGGSRMLGSDRRPSSAPSPGRGSCRLWLALPAPPRLDQGVNSEHDQEEETDREADYRGIAVLAALVPDDEKDYGCDRESDPDTAAGGRTMQAA